jgi:hypothetical protein
VNAIRALLVATAAALLWSQPALSDGTAVIGGYTTASAVSIEDIRKTLEIAAACFKLESILAGDVPPDFDPKSIPKIPATLGPSQIEPIRYELWTVEGCGHILKFTIQLWYDISGIERFAVSPPQGWLDGS